MNAAPSPTASSSANQGASSSSATRTQNETRRAQKAVTPRVPKLALDAVPRHWFANSLGATQIANGVNLLFPAGERFFIRSVRHYLDRVSPELALQVKGFFGQEGRHAQAHERLFDTLRAQGFDIDSILERYEEAAFKKIEKRTPHALRLACTVALEHFTAILAEDALTADGLAHADPEIRRLLEWHAVEELEHKAVAFDVMREVHPSYALRVAGMVVATMMLSGFWVWATNELIKQDGSTFREALRDLGKLRKRAKREGDTRVMKPIVRRVFMRGIREYLRPDFHPMDRDHTKLIAKTLERLAREGVVSEEDLVKDPVKDPVKDEVIS